MKNNKFIVMIMMLFTMLLTLTSCETISKDNASTIIKYEVTEVNGLDTVKYKAQITNSTIYNFYNINFDIEIYKDGKALDVVTGYDAKETILTHGQSIVFEGSFNKEIDFDEAKIINLQFETTDFMETYRAFVILIPIVTIVISAIVMYQLLKSDISDNIDARKTSAVGIFGLFAMSLMINTIGWVPILFIFVASGLIFLSGYIAVVIKKHQYIPQEVIDEMNRKEEAKLLDNQDTSTLEDEKVDIEESIEEPVGEDIEENKEE